METNVVATYVMDLGLILDLVKQVEKRFSLSSSHANMVVAFVAQCVLQYDPEKFLADIEYLNEFVENMIPLINQEVVDDAMLYFQKATLERQLAWSDLG